VVQEGVALEFKAPVRGGAALHAGGGGLRVAAGGEGDAPQALDGAFGLTLGSAK